MSEQIYKVRDPQGRMREIRGPAGASDADVIAQAQRLFAGPKDYRAMQTKPEIDPTEGMSAAETTLAGAGKAFKDVGRGAAQLVGMGPSEAEMADIREQEKPLMATAGGNVGNIGANVLMAAPASVIPGANTAAGAGVIGGVMGLLQPTGAGESKVVNTAVGAGLGAAGQKVADRVFGAFRSGSQAQAAKETTRKAQNVLRDANLREFQDAGYVIPPSAVDPSFLSKRLESVAGKAAIGQEAAVRNQEVTNSLARKSLGMPENAPITQESLEHIRKAAAAPYEEIATLQAPKNLAETERELEKALAEKTASKVSAMRDAGRFATNLAQQSSAAEKWYPVPGMPRVSSRYSHNIERAEEATSAYTSALAIAKQREREQKFLENQLKALKEHLAASKPSSEFAYRSPKENLFKLREARNDAQVNFAHYNRSAEPGALEKAKAARALSEKLENALEEQALAAGRQDLVESMRKSRTLIAKSHDVERALSSDGNVDAAILGKLFDKKRNKGMTGELATIGKFANQFSPYAREGSKVPTPGVSKVEALASVMLGMGGSAAAGPIGAAAAAIPLASGPVRSFLLSKTGQKVLAKPNYKTTVNALSKLPQEKINLLARTLAPAAYLEAE